MVVSKFSVIQETKVSTDVVKTHATKTDFSCELAGYFLLVRIIVDDYSIQHYSACVFP